MHTCTFIYIYICIIYGGFHFLKHPLWVPPRPHQKPPIHQAKLGPMGWSCGLRCRQGWRKATGGCGPADGLRWMFFRKKVRDVPRFLQRCCHVQEPLACKKYPCFSWMFMIFQGYLARLVPSFGMIVYGMWGRESVGD